MRVEYINPFVESAFHILRSTVSEDVKRGELSLSNKMSQMLGVVIIIGLAGQVSGRVVIDLEKSTALGIASKMNDEELTEFDELVNSTLTELGNMITGTAVTKLHELGFKFDITPPALFVADNMAIADDKLEALVVPIEIPQGKISINVAVKENK